MSVIFSRACEYAIRGLVEMARHPERHTWRVHELAELTGTPAPFLAKTFQALIKAELLHSQKGRRGGFLFAKPPAHISLLEVVEAIDGTEITKACALGFPRCSSDNPCPIHSNWEPVRNKLIDLLANQTIQQIS